MKFNCTHSELNTLLSVVSRAAVQSGKQSLPILSNVLLIADKDKNTVSLEAFDLTFAIFGTIKAEVEKSGRTTVPAKMFAEVISKLKPGEDVEIESISPSAEDEELDLRIKLVSGKSKYNFPTLNAKEFPEILNGSSDKATNKIKVRGEDLKIAIAKSISAVNSEDSREIIKGINLVVSNNSLEITATDSHKVAMVDLEIDNKKLVDFNCVIPEKVAKELSKMLSTLKKEANIFISYLKDSAMVMFTTPNITLTSRTIEGDYPPVRQMLKNSPPPLIEMIFDKAEILSAINRISATHLSKNIYAKFDLDIIKQTASIDNKEGLVQSLEVISGKFTSKEVEKETFIFDLVYLKDSLVSMPTKDIKIEATQNNNFVKVSPIDSELNLTYIVVPCIPGSAN